MSTKHQKTFDSIFSMTCPFPDDLFPAGFTLAELREV